MQFKNNERVHLLTTAGRTNARQSLVTVLLTNSWKYYNVKVYTMWFKNISAFTNWSRTDARQRSKKGPYACQWLDNAAMHDFALLDQNIPHGSKVMCIFTN